MFYWLVLCWILWSGIQILSSTRMESLLQDYVNALVLKTFNLLTNAPNRGKHTLSHFAFNQIIFHSEKKKAPVTSITNLILGNQSTQKIPGVSKILVLFCCFPDLIGRSRKQLNFL